MQQYNYRFGEFEIDQRARELSRDGVLVALPPLAFDCLVYLIEHRNRVVGRDELIAAVWGRTSATDDQLYHLVRSARRALGERGDADSAIRTLPRVGFRWVREVAPDQEPPAEDTRHVPAPNPAPATATSRVQWRGHHVALAALAALVCVAAAGFYIHDRNAGTSPAGARQAATPVPAGATDAIAVLPVETRGLATPDDTWIRLGLMDFIAGHLRQGDALIVPSDNVVALALDGQAADLLADRVRLTTRACCVVQPTASRAGTGWVVQLHWDAEGQPSREVEAHAEQLVVAARGAADQLLALLGKSADEPSSAAMGSVAVERYQRAEAAVLRGDLARARQLLETAPEPLRSAMETRLRLASIELREGRLESARQMFIGLLATLPAETEPLLRARAQAGLAASTLRLGDATNALSEVGKAIDQLQLLQEPRYLAQAYNVRGAAYAAQGRFDLATADFSSARVAFELAGDTLGALHVEMNEGALAGVMGRPAAAVPLLEHAAQGLQRYGENDARSVAIGNQITAYLNLLQPAKALAVAIHAGTEFDRLPNSRWSRDFRTQYGRALMANGRLTEARSIFDDFIRNSFPGEEERVGIIKGSLARMDLDLGRPDTAAVLALQAVGVLSAPDARIDRGKAWLTAIRALRLLDRQDEASAEMTRFSAWAETMGDAATAALKDLAQAELAQQQGRHEEAGRMYQEALATTDTIGDLSVGADLVYSYANVLIDEGELEKASTVVGRVARYAEDCFHCTLLQLRLYHSLQQRHAWQAALERARSLAGERSIATALTTMP